MTSTLSVDPIGPSRPDTFTSQTLWVPCGARGVFGGQVIAQALASSSRTIHSNMGLHSTHSYFLLPASGSETITYQVERVRDGKSYATRLVKGLQRDKTVFILLASYSVNVIEGGVKGETPFGFIPTSKGMRLGSKKKTEKEKQSEDDDKQVKFSHSLRFTVEPGRSVGRESTQQGNGKGVMGHKEDTPGFVPQWQIAMPDNLLEWDECEQEEDRWITFLKERGEGYGGKAREAVEEYIQVGSRFCQYTRFALSADGNRNGGNHLSLLPLLNGEVEEVKLGI
jgi:acyl-CoA thioesterase 8